MKYNLTNAKRVLSALIAAGAPSTVIPFLMAQVAHETGDFDSKVFRENNNASGIMFINKPERQRNATRGRAFPVKEWPSPSRPLYYANFASLTDWARDYLRIVGQVVLKSSTPDGYAAALKKRGYYTAPLSQYAAALKAHLKQLQSIGILTDSGSSGAGILPLVVVGAIALYLIVN